MKGRDIRYSAAELAWIEANRTLMIRDLRSQFVGLFGRDDVSESNLHSLRKRKGWSTGRTGCFVKGQEPHNKGKPHPARGRSAETQFKKGHGRSGIAVDLYKPIGTERLCKDGYREIKIHDGMPLQSRWRAVHLVEWEKLNGPIPKGLALKCLDGNRLNTEPSNWEPIPRAMLPRLSGRFGRGYDQAPAELKPTIMAISKLEHRAAKAGRAAA